MHFTAFDPRVNNLQTERRKEKGRSHRRTYAPVCAVRKERRKRGDQQGRRVQETNSDSAFLCQISPWVTELVLPLQVLLHWQCYICFF